MFQKLVQFRRTRARSVTTDWVVLKVAWALLDTRFRIIGHTDASGPDAYNDLLSVHRAMSVQDHLVGHCGIKAARLEAVGVGERYLADASNPRSHRNRRVEFQAITQAAETQ